MAAAVIPEGREFSAIPGTKPRSVGRQQGRSAPAVRRGNHRCQAAFRFRPTRERSTMKGIIAWLLGVPIFVIILLYLTGIF